MKNLKHATVEERLNSLDLAMRRLMKRTKKSYVILMPPVPIVLQFEDFQQGISFVFPGKGTIKGGTLRFTSAIPKEGVSITATASIGKKTFAQSTVVLKSTNKLATKLAVDEGDVVTISGEPTIIGWKEPLCGVVTLLWQCDASLCDTLYVNEEEDEEDAEKVGGKTEERGSGKGVEEGKS